MRAYDVLLSGIPVGSLVQEESGQVGFRFNEDYARLSNRPVLGQAFEDDLTKAYCGDGRSLPPFFANLIPEGQLRELIERSFRLLRGDDLALLSAVGRDLPGAVEIRPGGTGSPVLEAGVPDHTGPQVQSESALRFSLAGVQLKFSVMREAEKIVLPAHGPAGEWIAKLDSRRFPRLVENEFATLRWANAAGFAVPDCDIQPRNSLPIGLQEFAPHDSNVFVIRRFDRLDGRRVHQEDFAQVFGLPPEDKYDDLDKFNSNYERCAVIVLAVAGLDSYFEFVRRLVFMVASGNMDAHLKNWSLVYPDRMNANLAPLYDQVVTVAWPGELKSEWALSFAGTRGLYAINEMRFEKLAANARVEGKETLRVVRETVERLADAWHESEAPAVMPPEHIMLLKDHWERSPLLAAHSAAIE